MKNQENKVQSGSGVKYFCPMKCEGLKTYDQPGNCPVCNMKLVPVDAKNQNGENHHEHHH
jgi:Cu2+-exporting ATPase